MIFQHELKKCLLKGGSNLAIEYGAEKISYAQLNAYADAITRYLLVKNMPHGTRIGLLFENTVELIYGIVGVANAGCVFVPLDPSWPANRLTAVMKKLDLNCILANSKKEKEKINVPDVFLLTDIFQGQTAIDGREVVYPNYDSSDALYIYFTSGSTGEPKGIVGKNESLAQFIDWEIREFDLDASVRVSQFISPYFDAFLRDVFVPLFAGGTLCIPPADSSFFTSQSMIKWIDDARVNLIHCVPSVFRIFKEPALIRADNFKELRYILLSGEKIVPEELRTWYTVFGERIQLVNLYGATETTLIKSFYRITAADIDKVRIPVGSGMAGAHLLVADQQFRPCNALMSGDLYIVSDYMTLGYLDNPQLNEEKFLLVPAGIYKGRRAFRTGDKARLLPDGNIELLGRDDRQIKLRGIRVEPEEIESLIMRSGLVQQAVVMVNTEIADSAAGELLTAFVIRDAGLPVQTDIAAALHVCLSEQLPAYMLPSEYIEVAAFPLLGNGKINYKELLMSAKENKKPVIAPANEVEKQLLAIWQEILGKAEISTDDSFHLIGGSSLSIMRLIARIFTQFKVRITLNDLFQSMTIQSQSALVKKAVRDNSMRIEKAVEKKLYALSSAQQRMYFNHTLSPEATAYNMPVVYAIKGTADADKLEKAIIDLANRHEILRTTFVVNEGIPYQVVKEEALFFMERIKAPDIDTAVSAFVRPFDLHTGPLFRVALVKDDAGKEWLLFDIHHIACDGISQTILFSDFLSLYEGVSLKPLNIQYKDYAEWENAYITSADYETHKKFWVQQFCDPVPSMELPVLQQEQVLTAGEGGRVHFRVEAGFIKEELRSMAGEGVTEFALLYTYFLLFMVQLTGQDDLVIGIVTSGRDRQQLEDIAGMFSKTLPVRFKLNPDISFRRLVEAINRHLVKIYDHQLFDLSGIQAEINKTRKTFNGDLFNVMLVYQNYEREQSAEAGKQFTYYEHRNNTSKYPLTLLVSGNGGQWDCILEYSSACFTPQDANRLVEQFSALVSATSQSFGDQVLEIAHTGAQYTVEENDISFNL